MFKKLKSSQGFTLIEVVLVLAIASLIFVIVFLAVGQAQESRRDTQRSSDLSRIAAQLERYAANNQGRYPENVSQLNSFVGTYITGSNFNDPATGSQYSIVRSHVGSTTVVPTGQVRYLNWRRCNGSYMVGASRRNYAVVMGLEAGQVCRDNR